MILDITGTEQLGNEENTLKNFQSWTVIRGSEHITAFQVKGSVWNLCDLFHDP